MLGRIAHDGDQDETDESLADVRRLDDAVDAADEGVGADGDGDGDDAECDAGGPWVQDALLFFFFVFCCHFSSFAVPRDSAVVAILRTTALKEICVRAQLEVEIHDVEDEQDDGGAVGEDQDVAVGICL